MPSEVNVAYITPSVLSWARKRSRVGDSELKKRLNLTPEKIAEWEQGTSSPPFEKAQKLAEILRVPFGFLFLSDPPKFDLPIADMRRLEPSYSPTLDFIQVVNDVLVKQDWYRDYLQEVERPKLKFIGSFSLRDNPTTVAEDIISTLGINESLRRAAQNWSDYLGKLSHCAEEIGILVMRSGVVGNTSRRSISYLEFQGFAISDTIAPVVFVNSSDFKTSQIFTLIHEIAHLWLGNTGISNPNPVDVSTPRNSIEVFCNRVAAEVLVPQAEFERAWSGSGDLGGHVELLARQFRVSSFVILRRAFEFKKIRAEVFFAAIEEQKKKIKREKSGGGNYYRNIPVRMSPRLTDAVLNNVRQGRLLYRDAARLLALKVPTLVKFIENKNK
jgi:Zn-dependent peptidase ImmA (M78 family)/transcriptional regulator with XRE-family HTH domain